MPVLPTGSLFGPALVLSLGRGVALVATFIVPVILARILAPAEFGTYRQWLLIFATLYGMAQLGMAESLFYFVPARPDRAGTYAANAILTLSVVAIAAAVVLGSLGGGVAGALGNPALEHLVPLAGCYLGLMLVAAPLEILLVARRQHAWASVAYALSDMTRAGVTLVAALVWGRLDAVFVGLIVVAAGRLAATLAYGRRDFGARLRPDRGDLRAQLVYALPLQLAVAMEIAQANVHAYVVSSRFDPATFALYSIGCLQIPLVDLLASSAGNVMMVRMRERLARGERDATMVIWRETARQLALVLVPLLCVLGIVARDLLAVLFTDVYAAAAPIFRIWLGVLLLAAIPAHGPLRVLGDTRFLALQTILKLAIVVVFIEAFMSAFGLPGAVLVMLAAMSIGKGLLLLRIRHLAAIPLSELLPWRSYAGIALAAAAAAVPAVTVGAVAASPLGRLISTGVAYLAVYVVLAWSLGLLNIAEKRTLIDLGRRVLHRARG